jgi:hypothetical protein
MKKSTGFTEFSFTKSAIYKIRVQGDLSKSWSEKLGGLQITVDRPKNGQVISVLIGQISDQSALSGILNTLYDHHLTILSLNLLNDND